MDNIQSLNIFAVYSFPSDAVVRRKKHGQLFVFYGCIQNVNFHEHVSVKYSLKINIEKSFIIIGVDNGSSNNTQ